MNNLKDNKALQNVVKNLFPAMKEYEVNTNHMVIRQRDSTALISVLAICDELMIRDFRQSDDFKSEVSIVHLPSIQENILDLCLRIDFYFKTDHLIFEIIIEGNARDKILTLTRALLRDHKITMFLSSSSHDVEYATALTLNESSYITLRDILSNYESKRLCVVCHKPFMTDNETKFICDKCMADNLIKEYI